MPPEQPNQVLVTADNRGPLINFATWLTLVVMCLATFTKIGSKLRKIGRLQGDDFLMFAAMVHTNDSPNPLPAKHLPTKKKEKKNPMLMNVILIFLKYKTGGRNRSDHCHCQSSRSRPRPTYQYLDYIPDRPISTSEFPRSPALPPQLHWYLKTRNCILFERVHSPAMLLSCSIYYHSAWPNSLFYFFSPPLPSAPSVGL